MNSVHKTPYPEILFPSRNALGFGGQDGTEPQDRCCSKRSAQLRSLSTTAQGETYLESTIGFERIQKTTLTDRLGEFAQNARDEADKLEPGPERQALLDKVRQAEAASEFAAWADSPGLKGPK